MTPVQTFTCRRGLGQMTRLPIHLCTPAFGRLRVRLVPVDRERLHRHKALAARFATHQQAVVGRVQARKEVQTLVTMGVQLFHPLELLFANVADEHASQPDFLVAGVVEGGTFQLEVEL
jgi:hypothetical protein